MGLRLLALAQSAAAGLVQLGAASQQLGREALDHLASVHSALAAARQSMQ